MEHGVRRAIGVVFYILGLGARELIPGVKTRDLQLSFQAQFVDCRLADADEIVVFDEIRKHPGMYQQSPPADQGVGRIQADQLGTKFLQQRRRRALLADLEPHATATIHALGKWAQVEADDGSLQPAARRRYDFVGIDNLPLETGTALPSEFNPGDFEYPNHLLQIESEKRCHNQFQPPSSPATGSAPKSSTPPLPL